MSIEHYWNYTKSFFSSFQLWCWVIMEDIADIELYEEIVGNPAYGSSSDTSKSDPVSFQFKEPRLTECREEDFFARARSRPDLRIISSRQKNIQAQRSCDTFVECGSSRTELYDNSTILVPTSNTSIFDTFATVARDVEPTYGTSVCDKCAILAPNVGPTSNISILDKFATCTRCPVSVPDIHLSILLNPVPALVMTKTVPGTGYLSRMTYYS